jgi:tRNA pseudouridine38-40 synthase
MVRSLVGTMVEYALDKRSWASWESLLQGGERTDSGDSAPAHGLTFAGVTYPNSPFNERENAPF